MQRHGTDDAKIGRLLGDVSRRRFLGAGAGALGAVAIGGLAGCGSDDEGGAGTASPTSAETTASSGAPRSGGTIKIAISDQTTKDSYDPQLNSSTLGLLSAGMLYDTLLSVDNTWEISPMLAEDWDASSDGKSYSFKLRRGVEFHTGKTLDSGDVKYTFTRMLTGGPDLHGDAIFGPFLAPDGILTPDPTTVRFQLREADGFFPIKLAFWYGRIIQRDADFRAGSMGTGPFRGVSFKGGEGFELTRNPNYWQEGLPHLDGITGLAVSDVATKIESVVSGDVDFADPGDYSSTRKLEAAQGIEVLENPFGFPYTMGIDMRAKPYDDPRVRRAIKMLMDRQRFVDIVAQGAATPIADLFVHPEDPFYPEGLEPPAYDPEQAKSLLREAGYGDGWKAEAWTTGLPGMPEMAVVFKAALAEGGIDVEVKNVPQEQWARQLFAAPIVANYWGRQHPSTMALYMAKTGGQWNEARMSDPRIDAWIAEAANTTDTARQQEIYGEIGRRYADETSCIWPFWSRNLWPHKSRLTGLTTNPTDFVDFRNASLAG
jgi:peptide/nickel transport system substrate-binding protein